MNTVRLIARTLFILVRIASLGYLITAIYAAFTLLLQWLGASSAAAFIHLSNGGTRFEILFPFTNEPFLLGYYHVWFVAKMLTLVASYGIFFWLLSNVFHTFKQQPLFTKQAVERLTVFTITNFILPCSIIWVIFNNDGDAAIAITALHIILGIFSYFMAAIFQQGFSLQREQDLII